MLREEWECGYAFRPLGAEAEVVALFWTELERTKERTERLIEAVRLTLSAGVHGGIGGIVPAAELSGQSVQSARQALKQRNLLLPQYGITSADEVDGPVPVQHLTDLEDALRLAVQTRNPAQATLSLSMWFSRLRGIGIVTPDFIRRWDRQFDLMRTRLLQEFQPRQAVDAAADKSAPLPFLFDEEGKLLLDDTEKEWRQLILGLLESLLSRMRQERSIIGR